MNTKQVLYNALKVQLDSKKAECDKYDNEVYTPAIEALKSKVSEWIYQNIDITANTVTFNGSSIEFNYGDSWGKRIDLKVKNNWDNKSTQAELSWRSGDYSKSYIEYRNYLNDLSVLVNSFDILETKLFEWRNENNQIDKAHREYHNDYNTLKDALNKLANEISTDSKERMKEIGFEIKTFKPDVTLNWDYTESNKEYYIHTRNKSIRLQYGRSQYDSISINGYKILGKKGNKYQVEVIRDGSSTPQNYDVLEKKFESFIEEVHEWESKIADSRKERTERDYAERTKK